MMVTEPRRPRDTNQLAKLIVDLATGEMSEAEKAAGQVKGGRLGGKNRAAALSPEQRSEIARVAAEVRWKKSD